MRDTVRMIVAALSIFAAAYVLLWGLGLFSGLGFHGTVAAVLGVFLTTVIGTGLMALLFHSSRTRHDDRVHDPMKRRRFDDPY